jgi:CheY-like chemotaxis protein
MKTREIQNNTGTSVGVPGTPRHGRHTAFITRNGCPPANTTATTQSSPSTDSPQDLLEAATDYAVSAVNRLLRQLPEESSGSITQRYTDLVYGLEVNYIFPNLAETERDMLVSLMKIRNALKAQITGIPLWRNREQKACHDHASENYKTQFALLCQQVHNSNIESKLNPVQARLIEEEFLSVVVNREENTKIFFRKPGSPQRFNPQDTSTKPLAPKKKILLINRNQRENTTLVQWFQDAGYETVIGAPGFESCRQALHEKPDLIVLEFTSNTSDWPGDRVMDGHTTFRVLSRVPKAQGIPVLGVTDEDHANIRDEALRTGALACLRKPLNKERLIQAVRVSLEDLEPKR